MERLLAAKLVLAVVGGALGLLYISAIRAACSRADRAGS